jgi:hypothetical protein
MAYIWETLEFERIMRKALLRDLNSSHGETRFGLYTTARKYLLENVLDEIKKIQPNMTDHGPKHVRNVLQNVRELLGESIGEGDCPLEKPSEKDLNGIELYVLGLSALLHDAGNVFKRKEHQKQISPIYDLARCSDGGNQDAEEKQTILEICKAHCGDGIDGSKNTLKFVPESSKLERIRVRPNLLAPILRLADELAEGEQRTSHFMITNHKYAKKSIQFHRYALSSSVDIDRVHERILLKYHITLKLPNDPKKGHAKSHGPVISTSALHNFLSFVYKRIEKVNQERQYAKHYCYLLNPFKETSASFVFWYKQQEISVPLDPVVFSDLVVPGDPQRSVVDNNSSYKEKALVQALKKAVRGMNT